MQGLDSFSSDGIVLTCVGSLYIPLKDYRRFISRTCVHVVLQG